MDTFYPGKNSLIFAVLVAFLSTKKGRNLASEIVNKYIKQSILFWIPYRLRCKMVERVLDMPPYEGRKAMDDLTRPWGAQWDYITKIQKSSWFGHWIVRDSNKAKNKIEWVESTAIEADLVIYYMHGGAFKVGGSIMYMESFIHIIEYLRETRGLDVRIFSVDYGRLPDVGYRRTKEDSMNGYRYLIQDLKINPKKIVFAGDSAGGNLVATLTMTLRDLNPRDCLPQPAGNVQISPWITVENSQSFIEGKVYQDCLTYDMLYNGNKGDYFTEGKTFANEEERRIFLRNPSISPLYGSFVGFCPTLVTYGGTEVLQHDAEKLITCLKRDQVKVDVITRSNAAHIWIILSVLSPTHDIWKTDCSKLADWCANCVL